MPTLKNLDNNIKLGIDLVRNQFWNVDEARPDFENWVPFVMKLECGDERYEFSNEIGATFSHYELTKLLSDLGGVIDEKSRGNSFDSIEFNTSERYFDLLVHDPLEPDLAQIELWICIGSLTEGRNSGYDKGFRFEVNVEALQTLITGLSLQLRELMQGT